MLSPLKSNAISQLAEAFYSFLPASGHKSWQNQITFATVAVECRVQQFWKGGSKLPAITALLERTYECGDGSFEKLVTLIINRGIPYRKKKGNPVTREDIENINQIILRLERKFPPLWDKSFLESLPSSKQSTENENDLVNTAVEYDYDAFLSRFYDLLKDENKQRAGLHFETFLYDLFNHFGLDSHRPFSVVGEQIDGSFELDHETYLIEAKWQKDSLQEKDLLIFRGKIEGKSAFTRGVFIALNGYTSNAVISLYKGKQPTFFLIEGQELHALLYNKVNFVDVLRFKRRAMAEGEILKSHPDCII